MKLADLLRLLLPEAYIWIVDPRNLQPRRGADNAIGIVIQPGPHSAIDYLRLFMTNPEEIANLWGHTGMYLRVDGRIVRAIGFDPNRLEMVSDLIPRLLGGTGGGVSGGTTTTVGVYYDERPMFRSPDVLVVEFPMEGDYRRGQVVNVSGNLPSLGTTSAFTHQGFLQDYLTNDGTRYPRQLYDPSVMGNCINSVIQILTRENLVISSTLQIRGRTGRLMSDPDADITAFQGQLTNVVLQGSGSRRQPNLVLHDLDTGEQILPVYQGRGMSRGARMNRRFAGAIATLGASRLISHRVASSVASMGLIDLSALCGRSEMFGDVAEFFGQELGYEDFLWEYASLVKIVLNILMEGFPAEHSFWQQPVYLIDLIVSAIVKFAFIYRLATGDVSSWLVAIWYGTSFVLTWFGG